MVLYLRAVVSIQSFRECTHTHTQAMRVFFAIRMLSQQISKTEEKKLPLTMPSNSASVADIVDLSELLKERRTTAS